MKLAINLNDDLVGSQIFGVLDNSSVHTVRCSPTDPDDDAENYLAGVCVCVPPFWPHQDKAAIAAGKAAALSWLARCAAKPNARKLVVLISSILVYADKGGVENRQEIDENTPVPPPATAYTTAMVELETALREMAATRKVPVCIVRAGLAYSELPFEGDLKPGAYRGLIVDPMKEREFTIPLGGANNIVVIHAADLAGAVSAIVDQPAVAAGKTYPLGDGHEVTLVSLVEKMARQLKIARPDENHSFLMRVLGWMSETDRLLSYQQKCDPTAFRRDYPDWQARDDSILKALS